MRWDGPGEAGFLWGSETKDILSPLLPCLAGVGGLWVGGEGGGGTHAWGEDERHPWAQEYGGGGLVGGPRARVRGCGRARVALNE